MKTNTLLSRLSLAATAFCFCVFSAGAIDFTGPGDWRTVDTNGVKNWQTAQKASSSLTVWKGVVADLKKREVKILAEAVGHHVGVTTEFALVGPLSDRAYEAAAISVAMPGDIVRAVEALGIPRGGCIGSRVFRFWPCGERFAISYRLLSAKDKAERPLASLFTDKEKDNPMLGKGGIVFTGGKWANGGCQTDTNMPSSIVSLYNAAETIFDVPFQVGQSEVYGRLTLGQHLNYGELIEFTLRPLLPADGKLRVQHLDVTLAPSTNGLLATIQNGKDVIQKSVPLNNAISWLRGQVQNGREPFVTLALEDTLALQQATEAAAVFNMLDGKGIKMDGKSDNGVFYRSFLPQSKWRDRKDRTPQPFELHLAAGAENKLQKTLTFIEEDWSGEGLDPKLTPKDYPFQEWSEFLPLVQKTGGAESKVDLLFVFAPKNMTLAEIMPGVRAVSKRLPLVYFFAE